MRTFMALLVLLCLCSCEKLVDPSSLPDLVKCRPTWVERTLSNWFQPDCSGRECGPMGRATVLVEFVHDGCRVYKEKIDNQALYVQGYAPKHIFMRVQTSSDALTHSLFDHGMHTGAPCRVFLFDDTIKLDQKAPNEDQLFVELCKDATKIDQFECEHQLSDKRLYTP